MRCFSLETLISFLDNDLSAEKARAVSSHAAGCAPCRHTLDWLQKAAHTMRTDDLQDPPRAVFDPLVRYFRATHKRASTGRLRRLIEATLLLDSSRSLEFSEARSIQGGGKQLLYEADAYDIDIRFHPADPPDYTDIIGQVLAPGGDFDPVDAVPVYLSTGNEARLFTLTDSIGVFHLRKVPEGMYDLKLRLPDREIALRGVSISRLL